MQESPFGRVVLVVGPEDLIADRTIAEQVARAREVQPEVTVADEEATGLTPGRLMEMTGSALFSAETVAVVRHLEGLPAETGDTLRTLVADLPPDVLLVLTHNGSTKGRPLVEKIRNACDEVVDAAALRSAGDLAGFCVTEARRRGGSMSSDAAKGLVTAIGNDLRALAAAVDQLLFDIEGTSIGVADVSRYFAGRAETSAFAVADDLLRGDHAAAVEKVRWVLATGGSPVFVIGAIASSFRQLGHVLDAQTSRRPEAALIKELGIPSWKLRPLREAARGWDPASIAHAIQAIATTDAEVKGAAVDGEYALERLLLTVSSLRRARR